MQVIYLLTPGLALHPTHIPQHGSPSPPMAIQQCVYVTWRVQSASACACLLLGGMKRIEANIKGCSQMGGKEERGRGGREGTLSRNAPVLVQPATSYHETSTDRWIHERNITEMFMHKQPKWGGGEGAAAACLLMRTNTCVVAAVRSAVGPAAS